MQQVASRSGKSDMTASDAESWARLRLVQGESSAKKWELVSSGGHTTLTVGADDDCTWSVQEEGVRPTHFSLHWDGSTLRAADVYNAGDVRVDGTLLTSQWRPLLGRVRIEFGKAALVVETSASSQTRSEPGPADQTGPAVPIASEGTGVSSAPPRTSGRGSNAPRSAKETLIGVAPLPDSVRAVLQEHAAALAAQESSEKSGKGSERPRSERSGSARSRSERPGSERAAPPAGSESPSGEQPLPGPAEPASERPGAEPSTSLKATLVGGPGIDPRLAGAVPELVSAGNPKANATLMGFNVGDALRGVVGTQPAMRVGGQAGGDSLAGADQRTVQGFPVGQGSASSYPPASVSLPAGRRPTRQGMPSEPPSAMHEAQARSLSAPPYLEADARVGSAWQEHASDEPPGGETLRGLQHADDDEVDARRRRQVSSPWEFERLSDIPTQMRDPASFEARRVRRGVPWRYVGVVVLTAVAYFAWLYLLDHI